MWGRWFLPIRQLLPLTTGCYACLVFRSLPVCFRAMFNGKYPDCARAGTREENPVVTNAQAQILARRTEAFHVPRSFRQVIVDCMKNANGGFPVDREQLSLGVASPFHGLFQPHRLISARVDFKTPKHFVVRKIIFARAGTAGPVEFFR
jgi:hypothetical protein